MAQTQLCLQVSMAWWFKPYLYTLLCFCYITQHEPNYEKVDRIVRRAVRVKGPVKNAKS